MLFVLYRELINMRYNAGNNMKYLPPILDQLRLGSFRRGSKRTTTLPRTPLRITNCNKNVIKQYVAGLIFLWEDVVVLKGPSFCCFWKAGHFLTSEAVQGTSLTLQGIDNIHGGYCLPLGVLGVGDCITDDILKEDLQNSSGLLVDQSGDTLDTTPSCQTTDGWLGDTLDIITKYFPVPLGTTLSQSFSSFTSA